jgi:hypothetical protein
MWEEEKGCLKKKPVVVVVCVKRTESPAVLLIDSYGAIYWFMNINTGAIHVSGGKIVLSRVNFTKKHY